MKTKTFRHGLVVTALAIMGTFGFAACSNDDNAVEIDKSDDSGYVASRTVTFEYKTYVSPQVSGYLKGAFDACVTSPVGVIDEGTVLVVLNSFDDLDDATLSSAYNRGAFIAVVNPTLSAIGSFFDKHPYWAGRATEEDIDGAVLYAFNRSNHQYVLTAPDEGFEASGGDVITDRQQNVENYSLLLSSFFEYLRNVERQNLAVHGNAKDSSDVKKWADHIQRTKQFTVNVKKTFRELALSDPDVFDGYWSWSVVYDIYPIHVYGVNGNKGADYYVVNMSASVANDGMVMKSKRDDDAAWWGKGWNKHGGTYVRWCGAYAKHFEVRCGLAESVVDGKPTYVENVSYPATATPSPESDNGSTTITRSSSHSFGYGISGKLGHEGSVKKDGDGEKTGMQSKNYQEISANINENWEWSESEERQLKDVSINSIKSGSKPGWRLDYANLPEYKYKEDRGFDLGKSNAWKSTQEVHGTWIWYLPDMPDEDATKGLKIFTTVKATYGFMSWITSGADLQTNEWVSEDYGTVTLEPMVRFKAGKLRLMNDFDGQNGRVWSYISNITIWDEEDKLLEAEDRFAESYEGGKVINLGSYKCDVPLKIRFKKDGKKYVYKLDNNSFVKTKFEETVILHASHDFVEEKE